MKKFSQFIVENFPVYHDTSMHNIHDILHSGILKTNNNQSGYTGPGQKDKLSFTRNKDLHYGGYGAATLVFDRNVLKNHGSIKPHSWESVNSISNRIKKGQFKRDIARHESEELMTPRNKNGLPINSKTVKHILFRGANPEHPLFPKDSELYDEHRKLHSKIKQKATEMGIPIKYGKDITPDGKLKHIR